ncbi:hypothetical protein [Neisseria lactamica]|nr:hypothetical protein [Neisseria lactamica]
MKKFQTARRCRLKIGADYSTMWVWRQDIVLKYEFNRSGRLYNVWL